MATNAAVLEPLTTSLKITLARVERGVPLSTLQAFVTKSGIELKDLYDIVIPSRTLKHRKAQRQTLSLDESDKFSRVVLAYDHAVRVFGNREGGRDWLTTPKERFEGRTPLQMLRTGIGFEQVNEMLGQIDHGMFA